MDSIARLDLTISAMCQRRASLHTQMMVSQLCVYEILAKHTHFGSAVMHGRTVGPVDPGTLLVVHSNPSLAQGGNREKRPRSPHQALAGRSAAAEGLGAAADSSRLAHSTPHHSTVFGDGIVRELVTLIQEGGRPSQARVKRQHRGSPGSFPSTQPHRQGPAALVHADADDGGFSMDDVV